MIKNEEESNNPQKVRLADRIPGKVYLLLAVMIYSAGGSFYSMISSWGAQEAKLRGLPGNMVNVYNVLPLGNIIACFCYIAIYQRILRLHVLQSLTKRDIFSLCLLTLSYTIAYQAFSFMAYANTTVVNVVLIQQLAPLGTMLAMRQCLGEKTTAIDIYSNLLATVGVVLAFLYPVLVGGSFALGAGELYALISALFEVTSNTLNKKIVSDVPIGIILIFRTGVGAFMFEGYALTLSNGSSLMSFLCPFLWTWISVYTLGFVVLGGVLFFNGVKRASAAEIAVLSGSLYFISAICFGFVVVGEVPNMQQALACVLILLSMAWQQLGQQRSSSSNSSNRGRKASASVFDPEALAEDVIQEGEYSLLPPHEEGPGEMSGVAAAPSSPGCKWRVRCRFSCAVRCPNIVLGYKMNGCKMGM